MPNLKKIVRRIVSVDNTKQITSAMKMVSTAKLQKAQRAIYSTRDYSRNLDEILFQIASRRKIKTHPLFNEYKTRKKLYVVVTADRGLCGGFNNNLSKEMIKIQNSALEDETVDIIVIGKKGRDYFKNRRIETKAQYVGLFDKMTIGHAASVAEDIVKIYLQKEYSQIHILYNRFKSMLVQEITDETLLPVEKTDISQEPNKADFMYDTDETSLIGDIITESLKVRIWKILLESFSSEQAARRAAMESATDNAKDMIKRLTIHKNRIRQAVITTEITEIVSGAEALK